MIILQVTQQIALQRNVNKTVKSDVNTVILKLKEKELSVVRCFFTKGLKSC